MMRGRTRRSDDSGRAADAAAGSDAPGKGSDETQPDAPTDADTPPGDETSAAEATDKDADESAEASVETPIETPIETMDTLKAKWLRALADAENARKRARSDLEDLRRFGSADLLRSLLPVLDNLQRALASPPADLDPQFLEGLNLIEQQWLSVLTAVGVKAVPAEIGAPLDTNLQRALLEQPSADQPAGTIVAEIARCYRLHDRLLREGQVVVAAAPANEPDSEPTCSEPDVEQGQKPANED